YYFVSGDNGDYSYSFDGFQWYEGNIGVANDFYGIAYSPTLNMLVLVSSTNESVYSSEELSGVGIVSTSDISMRVNTRNIAMNSPSVLPQYITGEYPIVPEGSMIYSATLSKLLFFDGTDWRQVDDGTIVS